MSTMDGLGKGIADAAFHISAFRFAETCVLTISVFLGLWIFFKVIKAICFAMVAEEKNQKDGQGEAE